MNQIIHPGALATTYTNNTEHRNAKSHIKYLVNHTCAPN